MNILKGLLSLLLLFSITAFGQNATGKVIEVNELPIAYATVQIGEDYGVVTNENGDFTINISSFQQSDPVLISFLGYKSLELTVEELQSQNTFVLESDAMSLDQVFLTNKKYTPEELLEKVIAYRDSNYTKQPLKRKVFLRKSNTDKPQDMQFKFKKSTLLSKSKLKEINNTIKDQGIKVKGNSSNNFEEFLADYYSSSNKSKVNHIKSTILINKKKDLSSDNLNKQMTKVITSHLSTDRTYKVKSGLLKVDDSLEIKSEENKAENERKLSDLNNTIKSVVRTSNISNYNLDFIYETKKYNYELAAATTFEDAIVYILNFSPDKNSAKYEGKLYINAEDFAIMKMEYKIADDKDGNKMNLKFLLGIKFVEQDGSYLVTYKKDETLGKYLPSLIKKNITSYTYFNRPIKFTENKINEDEDKKMLKFNILIESITEVDQELFFLNTESLSESNFENLEESENFNINYLKAYDPNVWEAFNIIEPVNALKNYETE